MSTFVPDSDDDDEDMFIMRGGASAAVSIYSSAPITMDDDNDDDDDDDVIEVFEEKKKKKRGRRARLNDDLRPKSHEVVAIDDETDSNPTTTPAKPSVFSSLDDDAVCVIPEDDPLVSVADDTQYRAQLAIANARELLGNKGDEEKIERDAELYAQRMAAENARRERHIKAMVAMGKARAVPPKSSSPSSTSGATIPNANAAPGATQSASGGKPITLRVRAGANSIKMKILTSDPLRKMLQPFCTRFNIELSKAVMEVDGEEIEEGDTATTYDLEDNNIIDVRVRK